MNSKRLRFHTWLGMLLPLVLPLSLILLLSGCSGLGNATSSTTPTPTEYIVPPHQTYPAPAIPCNNAVQAILQKQVTAVRFWYTQQGDFFGISVVEPTATPIPNQGPGSDDNIDVYTPRGPYHYDPDAQCIAQIRAAIKQVNTTLPASMQVKVERETTYS